MLSLRHTVPIVYGAVIMAELHVLQEFVWIIYRLTTGECLGFFLHLYGIDQIDI